MKRISRKETPPPPSRRSVDRKLFALLEVSQDIAASRNIGELTTRMLDASARVLDYLNCAVLLVNPKKNLLEMRAHRGYDKSVAHLSLPLDSSTGVTAWVAREGKPLLVADVSKEPRYIEGVRRARSELAVPLQVAGEVLGVLDVQKDRPKAFSPEDVLLLSTLANYAAIALRDIGFRMQIRKTRRALEKRTARLQNLIQSSADAILVADARGRITFAGPGVRDVFGCTPAEMRGRPASDFYLDGKDEARRIMEILGREGKMQGYETVCVRKDGAHVPISISASLLRDSRRRAIGSLGIVRDIGQRRAMEERMRETVRQLSEANERLERLVITDPLSHLYNRRYFHKKLREDIFHASRRSAPLALMMIDLDGFKKFNDVYGHLVGDDVIEQAGDLIARVTGEAGDAFRYGGEEFTIILPGASEEDAAALAEKLIAGYRELEIFKRIGVSFVSLSLGVSRYHPAENPADAQALARQADEAMYAAKRRGGGQCAFHREGAADTTLG